MLKRPVGRVRMKLAERLRELGFILEPEDLWLQEGGYRGPKWDLARWGAWVRHVDDPPGTERNHSLCSWSTMTDCIRAKKLEAFHPNRHYRFHWQVEPGAA